MASRGIRGTHTGLPNNQMQRTGRGCGQKLLWQGRLNSRNAPPLIWGVLRTFGGAWAMGVLYSVFPLEPDIREALPNMGVASVPPEDGRNPTPAELRSILKDVGGYKVTFTDPPVANRTWQAMVEDAADPDSGAWALLNMSEYRGEAEPSEIWFEKGWPQLIIQILVRVAVHSGPLVLFADVGGPPLVVRRGDDPEELYRSWQTEAG